MSALAVGWVIGCGLTGNIASRLVSSVVFGSAHKRKLGDTIIFPMSCWHRLQPGWPISAGVMGAGQPTLCERDARHGVGDKVSFIYFVPPIIGAYCPERPANDHATWLHCCAGLSRLYCNRVSTNAFIHDVIGAMRTEQVLAPVTAESMLRWAVMLFDVFVVIAGTMIYYLS